MLQIDSNKIVKEQLIEFKYPLFDIPGPTKYYFYDKKLWFLRWNKNNEPYIRPEYRQPRPPSSPNFVRLSYFKMVEEKPEEVKVELFEKVSFLMVK